MRSPVFLYDYGVREVALRVIHVMFLLGVALSCAPAQQSRRIFEQFNYQAQGPSWTWKTRCERM